MCHFNVIFQATKRKAELQMSNLNDFLLKGVVWIILRKIGITYVTFKGFFSSGTVSVWSFKWNKYISKDKKDKIRKCLFYSTYCLENFFKSSIKIEPKMVFVQSFLRKISSKLIQSCVFSERFYDVSLYQILLRCTLLH